MGGGSSRLSGSAAYVEDVMIDRRSGLETAGVDGVSGGVNMLAPWLV